MLIETSKTTVFYLLKLNYNKLNWTYCNSKFTYYKR